MPGKPLTPQRARFALEYLVDLKPRQAAIRAGYSEKTAAETAYKLLRDPVVSEAISAGQAAAATRLEVKVDNVLRELAAVAFANMGEVAKWDSSGITLRASSELTQRQRAAVAEVREVLRNGARCVTIKLHSKVPALEILAKHLGMFVERVALENESRARVHIYLPDNGRNPPGREIEPDPNAAKKVHVYFPDNGSDDIDPRDLEPDTTHNGNEPDDEDE